ncbi:hypothetical protein GCM10009347_25480 [Shewanella algicola]|uniref:Uncharacterized protein n=1 Tax=Shewanella algicola TaxID=640633 RepID=A0A9X1Z8R9_9GAMM|nr:hypothetical protein [Shewanella algicola]MCL1106139.1 hypothetical protein [Shewanella algicola]GGP57932.1 hypothetical protein GCM10009347_25480 [Shewanella algicola]
MKGFSFKKLEVWKKEAREISAMLGALIKIRKGCVKEDAANYDVDLEPRT